MDILSKERVNSVRRYWSGRGASGEQIWRRAAWLLESIVMLVAEPSSTSAIPSSSPRMRPTTSHSKFDARLAGPRCAFQSSDPALVVAAACRPLVGWAEPSV